MKKTGNKRPALTETEKAARAQLRELHKDSKSPMALLSTGNRGQPPSKFTEEYLEKIAKELMTWSKKDDSYFISAFCAEHEDDIDKEIFSELVDRSLVFKGAFFKVKERLINRVRSAAMQKKLDGNFCSKILPLIDKEYREWRLTELKMEAMGDNEKNITINIRPGIGLGGDVKTLDVKPDLQIGEQ